MSDATKNRIWDLSIQVVVVIIAAFVGVVIAQRDKFADNDDTISDKLAALSTQFAAAAATQSADMNSIKANITDIKSTIKDYPTRPEFTALNKQVDSNTDRINVLERRTYTRQ